MAIFGEEYPNQFHGENEYNTTQDYFYTADTHFSSEQHRVGNFRPFEDIGEMNTKIIDEWNKKVRPDDVVMVLGDFGDYTILPKLNGNIDLLVGNYERDEYNMYIRDNEEPITMEEYFLNKGFRNVYVDDSIISPCGQYELVHEPLHRETDKPYLFGHIHGTQRVKRNGLNVGVDCHHFKVLSSLEVAKHIEAIQKWMDDEVFAP